MCKAGQSIHTPKLTPSQVALDYPVDIRLPHPSDLDSARLPRLKAGLQDPHPSEPVGFITPPYGVSIQSGKPFPPETPRNASDLNIKGKFK